jgi:hypothetical protein
MTGKKRSARVSLDIKKSHKEREYACTAQQT